MDNKQRSISFWTYVYKKRPGWMVFFLLLIATTMVVSAVGIINHDPSAALGTAGMLAAISTVFVIKWYRYKTGKSAE